MEQKTATFPSHSAIGAKKQFLELRRLLVSLNPDTVIDTWIHLAEQAKTL